MTAQDIRFFQTFTYVLAGLVGFTIFIYILAKLVDGNTQDVWTEGDPARRAAIEARTAPLGSVVVKGEDAVTIEPTASATLSFREPPLGEAGGDEDETDAGSSETMAAAEDDAGDGTSQRDDQAAADGAAQDGSEATAAAASTDDADDVDAAEADAGAQAQSGQGEEAMAAAEDATDGGAAAQDGTERDAGDAAEDTGGTAGAESDTMVAEASGIDGAGVYTQGCNACHAMGVAGAPKLGDASAWEGRVSKGRETLYDHAINGYNAMPAKGGLTFLSDAQVKAAVDYMVSQL